MAWYNEMQPDWTEEGTQGMAMMDALKLMSALKGSEIEQLERQTNMMKLLGGFGGDGKRMSAMDQLEAAAIGGDLPAMKRYAEINKLRKGEMPGGGVGDINWGDTSKDIETIRSLAPESGLLSPFVSLGNLLGGYGWVNTPEEQLAVAKEKARGYGRGESPKQRASELGFPTPPKFADSGYRPDMGEEQGMNPIQMMLLQRLLGTMGR